MPEIKITAPGSDDIAFPDPVTGTYALDPPPPPSGGPGVPAVPIEAPALTLTIRDEGTSMDIGTSSMTPIANQNDPLTGTWSIAKPGAVQANKSYRLTAKIQTMTGNDNHVRTGITT